MELRHIELACLTMSALNVRHGRKAPDIADLLPSVRRYGILQPLLVRANGSAGTFEVVAGRRRYHAARALAEETGGAEPVPCAILDSDDDACAIEASLLENAARMPMDPLDQHTVMVRLVYAGRSIDDIAETFGLTAHTVRQRLALGNLLPPIKRAYRDGHIDAATLQILTMATKDQQKHWLKLARDPNEHAPAGRHLKAWLLGGREIPASAALFPLEAYTGPIVSDLFGDERYFADAEAFWALQNEAIRTQRDALIGEGWREVEILPPGEMWQRWNHVPVSKRKGGRVIISVQGNGHVEVHKGYLTVQEVRKAGRAEEDTETPAAGPDKPERSELTAALENYLALHRHSAVRHALSQRPDVALRLMVALAIGGAANWSVNADNRRAINADIGVSADESWAEGRCRERRNEVLRLLGFETDERLIRNQGWSDTAARVFARLLELSDAEVLTVLTAVAGDSLDIANPLIDALGRVLNIDMRFYWNPDQAFFDLIRDRAVLNTMLVEVACNGVAEANKGATGKVMKGIIRDCLDGANGRAKIDDWLPGYFEFPMRPYRTDRDPESVKPLAAWNRIAGFFGQAAPQPES